MTAEKDFKKLVRERMSKTGESYATARMNLMETLPSFLEQIRSEDRHRVALEVDARNIQVVEEASGQWVARAPEYPELIERAPTSERAQRLLVEAIWFRESGWRDQVDDETADYLDLTD